MTDADNAGLADHILAYIADALVFADAAGTVRVWNAAASALFGFTSDEAIGASLDLIIPEPLRTAHWAGYDRAMASGATRLHGRPTITRAIHKSGARLYVEMTFAVVSDADGVVVGSVAMARDVTTVYEKSRAGSTSPVGN